MVIKPLVGKHTAEKEDSERCMGLNRALVFAEEFEAKLVLLDQLRTERYGAYIYGQPHNVPQSQKDGRWLQ